MTSRFAFNWTPQRIERLKRYHAARMSGAAIARAFGCSKSVIYVQSELLGLKRQSLSAAHRRDMFAEALSKHGDIRLAAMQTGVGNAAGYQYFKQIRVGLGWQTR